MKKWLWWILTSLLVIILAGTLLLGLIFLEREQVAQQFARWVGWSVQEEIERADVASQVEMAKSNIESPDETIIIHMSTNGDVNGQKIRIRNNAQVLGKVNASDSIYMESGEVRGDVSAPHVNIRSGEERFHHDQETARVYGNITGQQIRIGRGGIVSGQVGDENSQIDLAGHLQGDMKGKQLLLRSTAIVEGDVYVSGNSVIMEPGAEVRGRFITPKGEELRIIKQEAQTEYEWPHVNRYEAHPRYEAYPPVPPNPPVYVRGYRGFNSGLMWIPFLIGLISIVLLAHSFMKKETNRALDQAWNAPWKSLWTGFLTLLVAIPAMFLLTISIIGFPLALAVMILLMVATGVGVSAIVKKVGSVVCDLINLSKYRDLAEIILGTVLIAHLVWIPILGWILLVGVVLLGLGSIMIHWVPRFQEYWREWRQKRKEKK